MTKKVFLIAGEASGDALGAGLMRQMKAQALEPVEFVGIGGPLMEQEGMRSLVPMEELSVMGIWEVLWQISRLRKLIKGTVEEIEARDVDMVVTIDLPDFNFEVVRRLKASDKSRATFIHYVSPSVWAWRPGRAKKIAALYDKVLCLFPFEPEHYKELDIKAEFVGHPLIEVPREVDGSEFRSENNIQPDALVLGLFLGSRERELRSVSAIMKEATLILKEHYPDMKVVVPTLPKFEYNVMQALEGWPCETIVVSAPHLKWPAFASCNVAMAVSGTVALELAYMGVPHVIAYKMHPLTWLILKNLIKVEHAHLANILLGKTVIPEFIQTNCDSLKIAKGVFQLLKNDELRAKQKEQLADLPKLLTPEGARFPSEKAAAAVLESLYKVS